MARYIKNVRRASVSMGPTEERGAALWVGYELEGIDDDLSQFGLIRIDDEALAQRHGVTAFTRVDPHVLGVERK